VPAERAVAAERTVPAGTLAAERTVAGGAPCSPARDPTAGSPDRPFDARSQSGVNGFRT
jgi:hypothetical protein